MKRIAFNNNINHQSDIFNNQIEIWINLYRKLYKNNIYYNIRYYFYMSITINDLSKTINKVEIKFYSYEGQEDKQIVYVTKLVDDIIFIHMKLIGYMDILITNMNYDPKYLNPLRDLRSFRDNILKEQTTEQIFNNCISFLNTYLELYEIDDNPINDMLKIHWRNGLNTVFSLLI
jgi:hypothetical protein